MIHYLDEITIIPSCALYEMHLESLIGKTGKVVEIIMKGDKIKGCWVEFPDCILNQKEWFVPSSSIIY